MRNAFTTASRWLRRGVVLPLRVYQRVLSPALGQRCKYYPSCSEYAAQAIERFGILRGLVLAGWRLLRCNPWSHGGFDPVESQRFFQIHGHGPERSMMLVTANIFQPLIDIFEPALKFFHTIGAGWGLSIVLLTVVIRALLLPLAFKQFHSMQKLQRVAPELKLIQNKYKEDKQRQQQEMMKLYKEHGVNPAASCLPLVAQIPVFIGLFYTLRTKLRSDICPAIQHSFQAHYAAIHHVTAHQAAGQATACGPRGGAGFLFISDLTNKATGVTLVVLIVLYVGTQLASSLLMSTPTMDKTQRQIMLLMPLFFLIFIIQFPAGLIVYWITTNAWTMLQQYVIRRRIGPVTPITPAVAVAATDARGGSDGRDTNGSGGAGLAGSLRGRRAEAKEPAAVGASSRRGAAPPPPPRKKKKRSGRRR